MSVKSLRSRTRLDSKENTSSMRKKSISRRASSVPEFDSETCSPPKADNKKKRGRRILNADEMAKVYDISSPLQEHNIPEKPPKKRTNKKTRVPKIELDIPESEDPTEDTTSDNEENKKPKRQVRKSRKRRSQEFKETTVQQTTDSEVETRKTRAKNRKSSQNHELKKTRRKNAKKVSVDEIMESPFEKDMPPAEKVQESPQNNNPRQSVRLNIPKNYEILASSSEKLSDELVRQNYTVIDDSFSLETSSPTTNKPARKSTRNNSIRNKTLEKPAEINEIIETPEKFNIELKGVKTPTEFHISLTCTKDTSSENKDELSPCNKTFENEEKVAKNPRVSEFSFIKQEELKSDVKPKTTPKLEIISSSSNFLKNHSSVLQLINTSLNNSPVPKTKPRRTYELEASVNNLSVLKNNEQDYFDDNEVLNNDKRLTFDKKTSHANITKNESILKPFTPEIKNTTFEKEKTLNTSRSAKKNRTSMVFFGSKLDDIFGPQNKSKSTDVLSSNESFKIDNESPPNISMTNVSLVNNSIKRRRGTFDLDESSSDISVLKSLSTSQKISLDSDSDKLPSLTRHVTKRRRFNADKCDNSIPWESTAQTSILEAEIMPKNEENVQKLNTSRKVKFTGPPSSSSTPKSVLKTKPNLLKSVLTKENKSFNKSISSPKNAAVNKSSSRIKMPNFALIHQKALDKIEDIGQMAERKAERAKLLLSGRKPDANNKSLNNSKNNSLNNSKNVSLKNSSLSTSGIKPLWEKAAKSIARNSPQAISSKKHLNFAPVLAKITDSPKKIIPKKVLQKSHIPTFQKQVKLSPLKLPPVKKDPKINRFGFKTTETVKISKEDLIKAVASKSKVTKNTTQDRKNIIKGVRSNRRFELLMNMRK